jgi:hypothetical protein
MPGSKGYCTIAQVQAWTQANVNPPAEAQITAWMEPAEQLIDTATGNPFLEGPVLGEQHVSGPLVWTYRRPLASVEAVHGYNRYTGVITDLSFITQYQVDNLRLGRLWVSPWQAFAYIGIDYTPVAAVPPEVSEATAALIASWFGWSARAGGGQVTSEKFADASQSYAEPEAAPSGAIIGPTVRALLGRWALSNRLVFA